MLDPDDIPSPLLGPGERSEVRIEPIRSGRSRMLYVVRRSLVLAARVAEAASGEREPARQAAEVLRSIGGIWAKAGQILSAAHAVFPTPLLVEVMKLHHCSPGFDPALARRRIEEELRRPIESLFSKFEDQPVAAGSFSQVHRAVLRENGVRVAVKVQRPGIERLIEQDMAILARFFRWYARFARPEQLRLREMRREIARSLDEELDYRREAEHTKTLRREIAGHGIGVPEVFGDCSSRSVLVTEYVDGVFLSDYLDVLDRDPDRARTWLDANGIDPRRVARKMYESILRQALENKLFHGEPSPGNVILRKGNGVVLIDVGAVGRLAPESQRSYARFFRSVVSREYRDAADRLIRFFEPLPPVDLDQLKKDIVRVFRSWDAATRIRELPYAQRSTTSVWARIGEVSVSYHIPLEWVYVRLDRATIALDVGIRFLHERIDYHRELARYFRRATRREARTGSPGPGAISQIDLAGLDVQIEDLAGDFADVVRRNSLAFESTGNKLASVVAVVFRRFLLVATLVGAFLLALFVDQRITPVRPSSGASRLGEVLGLLPHLSAWDWLLALGFSLAVYRTIAGATRRLSRKESQYRSLIP